MAARRRDAIDGSRVGHGARSPSARASSRLAGTRIDATAVTCRLRLGAVVGCRPRGPSRVYLAGHAGGNRRGERAPYARGRCAISEAALWGDFERYVPVVGRARGDRGLQPRALPPRRRRLPTRGAASSRRRRSPSTPDPFASRMPTYQRMLFLSRSTTSRCRSSTRRSSAAQLRVPRRRRRPRASSLAPSTSRRAMYSTATRSFTWCARTARFRSRASRGPARRCPHGDERRRRVRRRPRRSRAASRTRDGMPVAFSLREALAHAHDSGRGCCHPARAAGMVSHIVFVADGEGNLGRRRARARRKRRSCARCTGRAGSPTRSRARSRATRRTCASAQRRRAPPAARACASCSVRGRAGAETAADALAMLRDHRVRRRTRVRARRSEEHRRAHRDARGRRRHDRARPMCQRRAAPVRRVS